MKKLKPILLTIVGTGCAIFFSACPICKCDLYTPTLSIKLLDGKNNLDLVFGSRKYPFEKIKFVSLRGNDTVKQYAGKSVVAPQDSMITITPNNIDKVILMKLDANDVDTIHLATKAIFGKCCKDRFESFDITGVTYNGVSAEFKDNRVWILRK